MSDYLSELEPLGFMQPLFSRLQQIRTRLRFFAVPLLAVATFTLAAVFGLVAFKLQAKFVELALAGAALFVLALLGTEVIVIVLFLMSSAIVNVRSLPYLFGFSPIQLIVFFLLGLILANRLSNRESFVRTSLDWPIFLFIGATIVSFVNAKYNLGTVSSFRNHVMQIVLVYLLFFGVTNLIKTRRQLMILVGGMFAIGIITAGLMVAQQAVGSTVSILPGQEKAYNATVLGQEMVGAVRVKSDGSSIVYVMLLPALILHITPEWLKGRKWLWLAVVALLPLAIAFTFDRNLWLGTAGGGAVFVLLSRARGKRFIFLILMMALGAILLGTLLSAYVPRIEVVAEGLFARFNSFFAGDELVYDSSTQGRLKENEFALATIKQYPILGIGPMADYYHAQYKNTYYVHNAYFWLLVDFGVVGFLPFLWFSVAFLIKGFLYWSRLQDPVLKSLVIGFTVSYVAILISSVATPKLLELEYVPLISVMMGINHVAIRLEQESSQLL